VFGTERLETISEDSDTEVWARWLRERPPRFGTFVATREGEILGFASLGSTRDGEDDPKVVGELYAIYVLPEAQGQGIGQALMVAALSRLRAEGFAEAILWVLEDNPRTRRYYELAGWHADGGVKDDELLGMLVREVRYRIDLR
jgi:GNAT superfamily N-acetyltransferase